MRTRQPLPRLWLMTDERQGEALWAALERLPRGAGIVFRHYSLSPRERAALFARVRRIAKARRIVLLSAAARLPGSDGTHNGRGRGLRSATAHNLRDLRAAEREGAHLVFLSPVFPTRSHPGAKTLGRRGFAALARQTRLPVVALGGMSARRSRGLREAYGWAGIDGWI